ncbi:hypothetical protein [Streptomyces sp. NPDC046727]|uniref:hypothetical protein n=1 Tax=Streptomyces sp. NPDC046727 TaxID=3155373 RepID=UPI00340DDB38
MRKVQKAAVAAAIVAGLSYIGSGASPAQAAVMGGGGCKSHDMNIDILGEVGVLNGLAGNLLNGEGNPGAQYTDIGSDCGHGY